MKSEGFLGTLKFMAARLAIAEIVVFALTGLVCWFIGWRTLAEYSTGLLWAGFGVMVFGAFSVLGGATLNSDFRYQYSKTVMPVSANQRMQQNVSDLAQGMSFTVWAALVGVITIILAFVLKSIL
jgi:hypothetical protein